MSSVIPESILEEVEAELGPVGRVLPVGGGSFGSASRVEAAGASFLLKHAAGLAGRSFGAEAEGLAALREAARGTGIAVPKVLHVRDGEFGDGMLLLEWIQTAAATADHWSRFGEALAALHRKPPIGAGWGFPHDNFIGATPQANGWMSEWPAFFWERRLMPQIDLARRQGRWMAQWDPWADRLLQRLEDWLPAAPARSLLHGDLWSGNHLVGADGAPWLIDPAVYLGDREADLAMTELFGGFPPSFYESYRAAWPLAPGYEERRSIYNLYHLLNHLNLFGSAYAPQVARTLQRFVS